MNRLNLGCGNDYKQGWWNIDNDPFVKADYHGDGNQMPFDNNYFQEVYARHSLEHFGDLFIIVDELGRVSADGCKWTIITPYCTWTQGWGNPHHICTTLFHENTFRFFDKGPNGIHKRRQQDYSIETVKVEYDWNRMHCHEISTSLGDKLIHPKSYKDKYLNVVQQITYNLICQK